MRTINLSVLEEGAGRPFGNPFMVKARRTRYVDKCLFRMDTGLTLELPEDMTLTVKCLVGNVVILNYFFDEQRQLCFMCVLEGMAIPDVDNYFAEINVVQVKAEPIRFLEIKDGARHVVGDAKETTHE